MNIYFLKLFYNLDFKAFLTKNIKLLFVQPQF
jgi:hypothetical protein